MRWFDSTRRALVYKLKLNLEEKLGTHNAFNFHKTHVQEYLQNLVQDLPAKHVLHGAELVAAVDFGGEWQARTIWDAVKTAAKTALIISGGDTIVFVTDISSRCSVSAMRCGQCTLLISPTTPVMVTGADH